jgi:phospholipid-binding lipoprotein MlaA
VTRAIGAALLALALAAGAGAAGDLPDDASHTAGADEFLGEDYVDVAESDPLEPSNRAVFGANEVVYRFVFDPVTDFYELVLPKPVRRSVLRFFDNLGEPAVVLNELLQLNPVRAGRTGARFAINTTVGVAGLFDPARKIGLEPNRTDFGETLGAYGLGQGVYLVIPVLGPSTARDLVGSVVNGFLQPHAYFLAYAPTFLLATGGGLSRYEANRPELEALREGSVDFYSALRSAYLMERAAGVREARAASPALRRLDGRARSAP